MGSKRIGLLLADEEDWPSVLEALIRGFYTKITFHGKTDTLDVERVRIRPFAFNSPVTCQLVIDRLAYWHYTPREWLKKAILVDGVYTLNSPFTFQCLEKHAAYCAMYRLGCKIPETWLIPPKQGPNTRRYRATAVKYHDLVDISHIANQTGYPLYMKPFDGGGWRAVSRIENSEALKNAYDGSQQMLMLLQAGLDNHDVFLRALGIGPQVIILRYDPSQPMHARYVIEHDFLTTEIGREAEIITKLVNAFFCWEFNTCEAVLTDDKLWLIDYTNAYPDIGITTLHYFFPWAVKSLLAWSVFCLITERPARVFGDIKPYLEIADSDRSYREKLSAYEALADAAFETERFDEFRATCLKELDEIMWRFVQSPVFDNILVQKVRATFPPHEHDHFIGHYRGLLRFWVEAEARCHKAPVR